MLAVVLLALLILLLAARPVLVRLPRLRQAVLALSRHRAQAESLQQRAGALQERIVALQRQAESAQESFTLIRAGRGN